MAIQLWAKLDTISVAKWRGPLQICQACTMLGESHSHMPLAEPNMHHTREVPAMPNSDSPPYLACSSSSLLTTVEMASSQLMRCQPGSSLSLGLVRFKG